MANVVSEKMCMTLSTVSTIGTIFGFLPFTVSKSGITKSRMLCVYSFLLNIINIINCVNLIHSRYEKKLEDIFYLTTDIAKQTALMVYVSLSLLVGIMQQDNHVQLILDISNCGEMCRELIGYEMIYYRIRRFKKYIIFGRFYLCTIIVSLGSYFSLFKMYFTALYFIFGGATLMNLIISSVLSLYIYTIKNIFRLLNQQLQENNMLWMDSNIYIKRSNRKRHFYNTAIVLNKISVLHHHTVGLINNINALFGIIFLGSFGITFILNVLGLYYMFIYGYSSPKARLNFMSAFFFAMDATLLSHLCSTTISEMNKTGVLIHKIETDDPELREEIEIFSLQIANEKVEFNAAGFFNVNYTLLFSIFGGVTTYIIILIQLSTD